MSTNVNYTHLNHGRRKVTEFFLVNSVKSKRVSSRMSERLTSLCSIEETSVILSEADQLEAAREGCPLNLTSILHLYLLSAFKPISDDLNHYI